MDENLITLQTELANVGVTINEKTALHRALSAVIDSRVAELNSVKIELADKVVLLAQKNLDNDNLRDTINAKDMVIAAKDAEIAELKAKLPPE